VGGFNIGALMGRIGGGSRFRVGLSTTVIAPQSGSLYLAMNDSAYDDNSGAISVNVAVQASSITRVWTGASGFSLEAGIKDNWQDGLMPLPGDSITFSTAPSRDCNWNIFGANIGVLTLPAGYTGTLRIVGPQGPGSYNQISVSGYVYVDSGTLDLGSNTDFSMQEKMLWVRGGTLDMGQGYNHLRLARPGLRVRGNGHFRSAGGIGPVTVESNNPYDAPNFNVENGSITLNNASYTEFINTNGVDLSSNAIVDAFHYARFGGNASMSRPALTIHGHPIQGDDFFMKGLDFGGNISTNVSAVEFVVSSTITLLDAKGPRMGSVFESDSSNVLFWAPDGGGQATVSGNLSAAVAGPFTIVASTVDTKLVRQDPNALSGDIRRTQISGTGSYSLTLPAPSTWYILAWQGSDPMLPVSTWTPRGGYNGTLLPGFLYSDPVYIANNDNKTGVNITVSALGRVAGGINNASGQFGPIRVWAWNGAPLLPDSTLLAGSYPLPSSGGPISLGVPATTYLYVQAFVDVNGNTLPDGFENSVQAGPLTSTAGSDLGVNITLVGGSQGAPGGTLNLYTSDAHPGFIANFGHQAMMRINLSAANGDARWNALKLDVFAPQGLPKKPYSLGLWKDSNNNGVYDSGSAAGSMDYQIGYLTIGGGLSSGTVSLYQPELISPSATQYYFVT
ncbi:MAG: hypothetical protein AABZ63_04860, partial [Actinomycetota bacterium]